MRAAMVCAHRGPAQVVPAAQRAFTAAMLSADVRLVEPVLEVTVAAPADVVNDVYATLNAHNAQCHAHESDDSGENVQIGASMAVRDSIGLVGALRGATRGRAFPSLAPAEQPWQIIDADPYVHESTVAMLTALRTAVGRPPELPRAVDIADKL